MALNIVALLLVLAITFMHSVFGFFSGLINVFCAIVSMVVALGFFEALNDFITRQFGLSPAYTEPCCLVALFVVTIVVTRTLADNYIRSNVKLPAVVDWGGAAVCGFINAQIFVGIIVLGVLMLPLRNPTTGTALGFARFTRNPDVQDFDHPDFAYFERNSLWTRSDEFTLGLFNLISSGSMRGKTAFASVYPDFAEAVFYSTNTVQPESTPSPYRKERGRVDDGFTRGLSVETWWVEPGQIEGRYRKEVPTRRHTQPNYDTATFEPASGKKLIGTLLVLHPSSADRDKSSRRHLFRPTMLRIVGEARGTPEQYVPRILANADPTINGRHRIVDYDNNFSIPGDGNARIYAYFEVDQDFKPAFVEYRRHARAALDSPPAEHPPEVRLTLEGGEESGRGSGRASTFEGLLELRSGDNPTLPFAMSQRALQRAGTDVTIEDGEFASGRVFGSQSALKHQGEGTRIERFKVPEGKRLIQVRYRPRKARSVVGDVFNFVGQVRQFIAKDRTANTYPMVGYYATITRGRDEYIEMFYAGDPDDPAAISYNHMLDFKDIDRSEINDGVDTIVSLLFLVPAGSEITRIEDQTGKGGDVSIRAGGP